MIQSLCKKILFDWMGYKNHVTVTLPDKYIIALAPHTSNWDFVIGILYSRAMGFRCDFMIKSFWFFWPMGPLMRALGGVPVVRSKNMSLTDQLAEAARSRKTFHLCITPEGTRKRVTEWKKGFYYIALKANIPILLYALDYKTKEITCTKSVVPDGNYDVQLKEIKEYYRDVQGKHPELFSI